MIKKDNIQGLITIHTPNKQSTIRLRAVPLPSDVTTILEGSGDLLKAIEREARLASSQEEGTIQTALTVRTLEAIATLKQQLTAAFAETGDKEWSDVVDHIWSFGPRRCGPNILLNRVANYPRNSLWTNEVLNKLETSQHYKYDSSFVNGFQMATLAGPLCEEPMMGVCYVIEDWTFKDASDEEGSGT